ncbi:hypothetical protein N9N08_00425 [bacterium]|jgi:hypothetical protein|nr:hypothetical protein [bacterium]|tara:strand:- start:196 stop:402 length:207 start_codon:yes stop_codon:yes gene_type:complete
MILEVHHTGDQYVAYDDKGNRITDRNILNELAFIQPPGFKSVYKIEVDTTTDPVSLQELAIKINLHNK